MKSQMMGVSTIRVKIYSNVRRIMGFVSEEKKSLVRRIMKIPAINEEQFAIRDINIETRNLILKPKNLLIK
jgi:hypothetical protein